jgi:hypothetical protein
MFLLPVEENERLDIFDEIYILYASFVENLLSSYEHFWLLV